MAKKPKQELEVVEQNVPANVELDDEDMRDLTTYEGAGTSQAADDNLIPIISLLQDLSPQVKTKNPEYVDGAEVGDFYIKGLDILIKGDEGFLFQPCAFQKAIVEWVPRDKGGGFVAQYEELPPGVTEVMNDKGKTVKKSEAGNDLVDTRYHFGYLEHGDTRIPAVLSFSSSGHTVSRGWMVQMNNAVWPGTNKNAPSWFRKYRVKSRIKQKNNNEWYICEVNPDAWVQTKDQRTDGKNLHLSFKDKQIDHSTAVGAADEEAPF